MHFNADLSTALQHLEAIKSVIDDSDDAKLQMNTSESLKLILGLLQDPVLRSIVQVQDSLTDLNKQIVQHPSVLPSDFDITVAGELVLSVPPSSDMYDAEYPADEQRVPSAQLSPRSPQSPLNYSTSNASSSHQKHGAASASTSGGSGLLAAQTEDLMMLDEQHLNMLKKTRGYVDLATDDRPQSAVSDASKHLLDVMSAEWAQIQALELVNDGTGLGFGIIGARSSGVIVKTILPGDVADRDARLVSGDHILQINDVNLHDMVSEQVASVLRQSGTHVRLVVARPIDPAKVVQEMEGTAIVPARLLSDPVELERYLIAAGYPDIFCVGSTPSSTPPDSAASLVHHADDFSFHEVPATIANRPQLSPPPPPLLNDLHLLPDLPETERFTVELTRDINGLGITIAGYVCEKEELSGIFVKSVSPGSAADLSGRIQVNDRIIEVNEQSLQGFNNHEAVEVLKKSGTVVSLCLERYLRGPKFEQLQQAIAANEKPQTPSLSSIVRPSSGQSGGYQENSGTPLMRRPSFHEPAASSKASAPVAVVSGSARKLLTSARDSIETKTKAAAVDSTTVVDSNVAPIMVQAVNPMMVRHKYWVEPQLTPDIEHAIRTFWAKLMAADAHIIVAQIRKFAASSGLGISLEGTVDVEGGMEVRPHHYIRSILAEGPVGQNGLLRSGDELLEVNGQRLLGMNHLEVVSILKELPQDVRMVCARGGGDPADQLIPFTVENVRKSLGNGVNFGGSQSLDALQQPSADRLVKAKSDGSLATSSGTADDSFNKLKSRSLEPLTGLAMWSSEPQIIELVKGERGLGFSILDYQDPLDANDTLIVIRSLVPGGVAQLDGRLIPGDRLLFVNEINLENSSLDQAVQALKGAAKGVVRIGVAKPLPMADNSSFNLSGVSSSTDANNSYPQQQLHASLSAAASEPDVIPEWIGK